MSELKPGGLAILIKAHIPSDVGHCVTTVGIVDPGECIDTPIGTLQNWTSIPVWYITGDVRSEFFSGRIAQGHALARSRSLLPINPEKVDEKEGEAVA